MLDEQLFVETGDAMKRHRKLVRGLILGGILFLGMSIVCIFITFVPNEGANHPYGIFMWSLLPASRFLAGTCCYLVFAEPARPCGVCGFISLIPMIPIGLECGEREVLLAGIIDNHGADNRIGWMIVQRVLPPKSISRYWNRKQASHLIVLT